MYLGYQNGKIKFYTQQELSTEFYNLDKVEYTEDEYVLDGEEYVLKDEAYEVKQIEAKKELFHKEFFNTSLGYVRRKVSMATGETKDFLSDLLPTISMGVQMGQPVTIITYKEPDFTQDTTDLTSLQEYKTVTAEFVQECFLQLSNDFKPMEPTTQEPVEPTVEEEPAEEPIE